MKRFEFQGKDLFARVGIRIPASRLVRIMEPDGTASPGGMEGALKRVDTAVRELSRKGGGTAVSRVVVKAQLDMGGRGKAGLIRVVDAGESGTGGDSAEPGGEAGLASAAVEAARDILSKGYTVPALLIEEAVTFQQELYLSISPEPTEARYVVLASAEGGVDIETLAAERPEAIKRVYIDPFRGLQAYQSRGLAYDLGLEGSLAKDLARLLTQLYTLFTQFDAELVEINPVFVTKGTAGSEPALVAGDAKVIIDDNSLHRHPDFQTVREQYDSDAAYEAALEGIPYLQFDGDISLMCAGAGLATTVFDLVNYEGGHVANYLEFGGPNYNKAQRAMELCLKNSSSVILIVTFGTIARADVMAEGVVTAIKNLKPDRPIVTCIRGTNEEQAHTTLREAGLEPLYNTEEAVRRAVALAAAATAQNNRGDIPQDATHDASGEAQA
ncbi:MAG: succinate--CoA ligase [Spirochaetaceae bacterium]|nr:MAG: succinate--CoA ligase [Spirochaetaceae bacterium]